MAQEITESAQRIGASLVFHPPVKSIVHLRARRIIPVASRIGKPEIYRASVPLYSRELRESVSDTLRLAPIIRELNRKNCVYFIGPKGPVVQKLYHPLTLLEFQYIFRNRSILFTAILFFDIQTHVYTYCCNLYITDTWICILRAPVYYKLNFVRDEFLTINQ